MYFGHYGIGLALKKFVKGLSLGWLFLSVQFVDILAMSFLLLGIEKANVGDFPYFCIMNHLIKCARYSFELEGV